MKYIEFYSTVVSINSLLLTTDTIFTSFRYNEAVLMEFRSDKDILRIANQVQEWFNKFFLCFEAAKSWHDISVKGVFAYTKCDGNQQLNWRKRGFKTILDVLMVRFLMKN